MSNSYVFPEDWVWGVAAASAQIEGAAFEDGKSESIWDVFPKKPGSIVNGDAPTVACDHYHRYREDAKFIREVIGLRNYRLSIAWPRIYPNGTGEVNEKGLEFYDRLMDTFLENEITPWVTLFHWDLPQVLEEQNGWLNRQAVDAFAVYAQSVVLRLGDRVKHWFTPQ